MLLSIIIVNYNVKYFLEKCLNSVERAASGMKTEVIVIDNASTDDSIAYLKPKFPRVDFVRNEENKGFAKANNQALHQSSGEYVLFLNPDTIIPEDAFSNCIAFMEGKPDAGALGVRMIDGSGKYLPESKRGFPSLRTAFYKLSGIISLFPYSPHFAKYYLGHLKEKEVNEADVLAGAFFLTTRKVLNITGSFDEAFFMYGEDVDLSYRIQQSGFKNYYFPITTIVHFKGESTKKGNMDYVKMFYNAMRIFVKKHYEKQGSVFLRYAIEAAIRLRALPAAILTILPSQKSQAGNTALRTVILGDKGDAEKAFELLNKDKLQQRRYIHAVPGAVRPPGPFDELIMCEHSISYKYMIALVQELSGQTVFRFYDSRSNVMIGSDSKNKSGMVVV
jgi:GT2 family glycosyltransferase